MEPALDGFQLRVPAFHNGAEVDDAALHEERHCSVDMPYFFAEAFDVRLTRALGVVGVKSVAQDFGGRLNCLSALLDEEM